MSLASGTRIGAYEILAPIGAGGMGEVYRARDPKLQRDIAITLLPAAASNPDAVERFQREARAVAALKRFFKAICHRGSGVVVSTRT